ncbi:sigma-70 family RNA polymerase sigma factor [Actinomadura graeca]|uniref:Sigma-70 family RNA polymerase sigma factor n=1 Tax=Actinomadura graeca TaxID=2750812 RepID=A0ABX8QVW2_9ACTN|nr:sigma-70 family RNA polymerase sigma factor [Actinomadura graeca]QXJ22975.1 sigma-70 family RNA polymerase sigma factor [Actinomadura graeca]
MSKVSPSEASADRTLVKGLNEGDKAALAALYDEYGERLYDYALSMTADEKVATGIVHDTFIDACRRAPRMRDHLHLSSWLYGAARRRCIRRGRQGALYWDRDAEFSDVPLIDPGDPGEPGGPGGSGGPAPDWPSSDRLHDLLQAALAPLDPVDREVVLLAFRHGMRPARLGAALGLSPRRAAARIRRGRESMEAALAAELRGAVVACAAGTDGGATPTATGTGDPSGPDPDPEARPTAVAVLAARPPAGPQPRPGRSSTGPLAGVAAAAKAPRAESAKPAEPADGTTPPGQDSAADAPPGKTERPSEHDAHRGPLSAALWQTFHRRGETAVSRPDTGATGPTGDPDLDEHAAGCPDCRELGRVSAVELLRRAPAPVLPAALRHRVMHTATDPELAGYRADIAARGGTLTPDGLPSQPDVASPFTRRWLITGGAMAGALAAALIAVFAMGPGLGGNSLSWPPFRTHPQPSISHQAPPGGSGRDDPHAPGGPRAGAPGHPGAPPVRPQTDEQEPTSPADPTPKPSAPSTSEPPAPPASIGVLVVAPAKIEFRGTKTAKVRLAAKSGPVSWTGMTSSNQLVLSQTQGGMPKDGTVELTLTLRTTLIGLPGKGTLTFKDSVGIVHAVPVVWGTTIL